MATDLCLDLFMYELITSISGGRLIYIVLKFVKVRASKNVVRQIKTTFSCPDVNIRFEVCYAVFQYTTDLYMYD